MKTINLLNKKKLCVGLTFKKDEGGNYYIENKTAKQQMECFYFQLLQVEKMDI